MPVNMMTALDTVQSPTGAIIFTKSRAFLVH
jgi:hypothetical protein